MNKNETADQKVKRMIKAAEKNGYEHEFSENRAGDKLIGFTLRGKRTVYHWFKIWHTFVDFDHTYSRNTGVTKRGLRHSWKVYDSLGIRDIIYS